MPLIRHRFGRLRPARIGVRATAAAALAFSALLSAGCGSDSHAAEQPSVDLSKLDTGSYATKPHDATASDPVKQARITEALRLADVVPVPFEIDPALTKKEKGLHVFLTANSYGGDLDVDHFDTDAAGFVSGFATAASAAPEVGGYSMSDAVMIFDSDANAATAAAALARSGLDLKTMRATGTAAESLPMQSAQHPAAQILWSPQAQVLASWYPTGRFVIFTLIHQPESFYLQSYWQAAPDPAPLALADKAIDVTSERLKSFRATPPDKLSELPLDPDGMLRLTLPRPDGDQTANAFTGTLDAHGALHGEDDPAQSRSLFEKTGVDAVSNGAGLVVRTRDADAARTYFDTAFADRYQHPIDPPAGLPNARCVKYHGPDQSQFPYVCHVAFGRYVATVWSQQQQDVYQRVAAQYAILANNK